tara:strand:+ start:2745 stop:3443 length:699 start_codon:yes stop_codon:yes gene_type:complete
MGTVGKQRRKYSRPSHPWQAERIEAEKSLISAYGFKNKKEIWKVNSILKGFKNQAKQLIAKTDDQANKEEKLLLDRLTKLGIIKEGATLDTILGVDLRQLLDRRLQTVVVSNGLARTTKQARQMITHGHISLNNQKLDVPSYLVALAEEDKITYSTNSNFNEKEHPELNIKKKEEMKKVDVVEVSVEEKKKGKEVKPAEEVKAAEKAKPVEQPKTSEQAKPEEKKKEVAPAQ